MADELKPDSAQENAPKHYSEQAFRRAAKYFLLGKFPSAVLAFANLALLVRLLSVAEYGVYVMFVAVLELTLTFSTFGLDWVMWRYLPEYRVYATHPQLMRFIGTFMALRLAVLLVLATLATTVLEPTLTTLELKAWHLAASVYVVVLVLEGVGRFLRQIVLESFLLQSKTQICVVIQNFILCIVLVAFMLSGSALSVNEVAIVEACTSTITLGLSIAFLTNYLRNARANVGAGWKPPSLGRMRSIGLHNYLSMMVGQIYNLKVLLLVAGSFLGTTVAAGFGFAVRITELSRDYLPGAMFHSVLRPSVIASYVATGDFAKLNRQAILIYKLSVFVLCPALAVFALYGDEVTHLITGGKYLDVKWVLFALLCTLVTRSHRPILTIVLNCVERVGLRTRAALVALLFFPLPIWATASGLGLAGLVVAVFIDEIVLNVVVVHGLRAAGMPYRVDFTSMLKMALASLTAYLAVGFVPPPESLVGLVAGALLAGIGYLLVAFWLKPFTEEERQSINRLIKRNIFVW